jgi:Flp pilus assembly protein TadG
MRRISPSGFAWSGARRDRRGSTTLEFAIVAFPFIIFLVFLLEIGYDFFAQVALNYGVQTAARQIQIGAAQGANTAAIFQTNYLCPALTGLLPCSSVTVNVYPIVSDYYANVAAMLPTNAAGNLDTSGFTYCPGKPNQLMLVQAIYTSPSLVSAVVPGMATATAGGLVRVTLSSTAFINENFPVTAPAPAGC